jgi:Tat protein translocase TatB subunit
MGIFGIGTGELLLILLLVLIIWGPGRLPELARTLGKAVRALKKASFDLTNTMPREIVGADQPSSQTKGNHSSKTEESPSGAAETGALSDQSKNAERHEPE